MPWVMSWRGVWLSWDGWEFFGERFECGVVLELLGSFGDLVVNEPESLILAQSERWRHA